jgi:hypothetical protein
MGSHIRCTCKLYPHDVDKENFTFHCFDTFHFVSWLCFLVYYDSRNKQQSFRSQPVIREVASEFLGI